MRHMDMTGIALLGWVVLAGCAIDDRTLIETDQEGNPIHGEDDPSGDGDAFSGPGSTCGVGDDWLNDGIGYFSDGIITLRGEVWGDASSGASITPSTFTNGSACASGTSPSQEIASIRWNIAQEYDSNCTPGVARSLELPGSGLRVTGTTSEVVYITISETTASNSRYWCYRVPSPLSGSAITVSWNQFVEGCDQSSPGAPYEGGTPVTTLQVDAATSSFDICIDSLEVVTD